MHDGRGSVSELLQGAETTSYRYDPFGEMTQGEPEQDRIFGFNGEEYTPQTGLVYLRARHYSPAESRFTTQDPYLGNQTRTASQNRYAYCENDPVNFADPSGYAKAGVPGGSGGSGGGGGSSGGGGFDYAPNGARYAPHYPGGGGSGNVLVHIEIIDGVEVISYLLPVNKYDFDKNPDAAKLLFTYGSKDYFKIPVSVREVPKDTPNSSTVVRSNITLTNEQIQQTVDGVLAAMAAAEAAARAAAEARARARRKARKAAEEKEAERKAESEREDENNKPRWNTKDPASIQAERERRQAVLEKIAQQKKEQEVKEKAGQAVAAVADKLLGIASSKEGKSTTTGKVATGPAGIGGGIASQLGELGIIDNEIKPGTRAYGGSFGLAFGGSASVSAGVAMDENGNTKPTTGLSVGGGVYGKAISGYILTTDAPLDVYTNPDTKTVSIGGAIFLGYYHVVIIGSDGNTYTGKMFTLGVNVGFSAETNAWWK